MLVGGIRPHLYCLPVRLVVSLCLYVSESPPITHRQNISFYSHRFSKQKSIVWHCWKPPHRGHRNSFWERIRRRMQRRTRNRPAAVRASFRPTRPWNSTQKPLSSPGLWINWKILRLRMGQTIMDCLVIRQPLRWRKRRGRFRRPWTLATAKR